MSRPLSPRRRRDPPGQLPDLDSLDHFLRSDIDDRNVVGKAVGRQEVFLVRRERHVPDPLADEQVSCRLVSGGIDDRAVEMEDRRGFRADVGGEALDLRIEPDAHQRIVLFPGARKGVFAALAIVCA